MTKGSSAGRGQAGTKRLLVPGLEMLHTLTSPTRVHWRCPAKLLLQRHFFSLQLSHACQTTFTHIHWAISPLPHSVGGCSHLGRGTKGTLSTPTDPESREIETTADTQCCNSPGRPRCYHYCSKCDASRACVTCLWELRLFHKATLVDGELLGEMDAQVGRTVQDIRCPDCRVLNKRMSADGYRCGYSKLCWRTR